MSKEKDYFTGSTKDVTGDIITHRSMRRIRRGHVLKEVNRQRSRTHHIQIIKLEDGTEKTIYHDTEDFRKAKFRKQVDRAHRR
jgi:hypothetical protein